MLLTTLGVKVPTWVNSIKFKGLNLSPLAAVFLAFCTFVATQGAACAGAFNHYVTSGKLVILAFLVIVALTQFEAKNFDPFLDKEKGVAGLIEGSTILFFGYLGFDFLTTVAEEAKNPVKDVPRAIIVSTFLCMVIYTVVAFSVQGVGDLSKDTTGDGETALAEVFNKKGLGWMGMVIFVAAILGITAAGMTNLMS